MINNGFKIFKTFGDFYYIQEKDSPNSALGLGAGALSVSENKIKEFNFFNNNKNNIKKIFTGFEDLFYIDKNNNFFATGSFFETNEFQKIEELSGKNIKHIFDINKKFNNVVENKKTFTFYESEIGPDCKICSGVSGCVTIGDDVESLAGLNLSITKFQKGKIIVYGKILKEKQNEEYSFEYTDNNGVSNKVFLDYSIKNQEIIFFECLFDKTENYDGFFIYYNLNQTLNYESNNDVFKITKIEIKFDNDYIENKYNLVEAIEKNNGIVLEPENNIFCEASYGTINGVVDFSNYDGVKSTSKVSIKITDDNGKLLFKKGDKIRFYGTTTKTLPTAFSLELEGRKENGEVYYSSFLEYAIYAKIENILEERFLYEYTFNGFENDFRNGLTANYMVFYSKDIIYYLQEMNFITGVSFCKQNILGSENKIIIEEKENECIMYNINKNKVTTVPDWLSISPFQFEINKIKKIKSNENFIFVLMNSGEFYVYGKELKFGLKEINKWNLVKFNNKTINKVIDFDLSNNTVIVAAEDFKGNYFLLVTGLNESGQLGTEKITLETEFVETSYKGLSPKKVYALDHNTYVIDENRDIYFTGKKEMLLGNYQSDLLKFEKFNFANAAESLHFTPNACIIETNQNNFFGFGLNKGLLLTSENYEQYINEPVELKQINDLEVEKFLDYKTEVNEYKNIDEKSGNVLTDAIKKIKVKYINNNNGTYSIKYLDTTDIKNKPLLVLAYSDKDKNTFKYVNQNTIFYMNKQYDFKVISLINDKYKDSVGIISFPKIKESIEIDKSNYTNLKINSELKDIISFENKESILITDKFKNKPLFFKFLIPEYKNEYFDLIDEDNNSVDNIIVSENGEYYCYFNCKNNTKYQYCFYNDENINNKKYKTINNILKSQYKRISVEGTSIYFEKEYIQNKVFVAEFMEHFDYDCVYKLPVPTDLLYFKDDIIITNDSGNYKNFFIVDGEFYIYHNQIKEMLNENYLYFEIKNKNIEIEWVKEGAGKYSNNITKEQSKRWVTFTNQNICTYIKEFYKNDDEIESFSNFKKYCTEYKIEFSIDNFLQYCFQNLDNNYNKTKIQISESVVKDKTPVWINSSPVKIDMWTDKSFDLLEEDANYEIIFLSNTIINSETKKIQLDYILSKEVDIENIYATFTVGKRYFKQDNKFVENEFGNIIFNEIKNEQLIYEPYDDHTIPAQEKEIEILTVKNADEYNIDFYKKNFKCVSMPFKTKE